MILNSPYITGSITVTGNANVQGTLTVTGSLSGTATSASLALNSNLLQGTGSVGFATTASLLAVSSSQQQISSSLLNVIANYATTGSNSFRANQTITGSLGITGDITASGVIVAQTLVVQTITSSISYVTGSTRFGSSSLNTHTFTGSVLVSGSIGVGTTPNYLIEAYQSASTVAAARFANNQGDTVYVQGIGSFGGTIAFQQSTGSNYGTNIGYVGSIRAFEGSAASDNGIGLYSRTRLSFYQNSTTPIMNITGSNVGIGITSPKSLLHLQKTTGTGAEIYASYSTSSIYSEFVQNSNGGALHLRSEAAASNILLRSYGDSYINAVTGSVGIGLTNPTAQVQIYGTSTIGGSNLDNSRLLLGTTNDGMGLDSNEIRSRGSSLAMGTLDNFPVVLSSNGNIALYITGSYVGIGSATPTGLLDVASRGITKGSMPAGTVLQVVQTVKTDLFSIASGTPTDITGFSASITPTSSTSKILIFTTIQSVSDSYPYPKLTLYRGSTAISLGTAGSNTSKISVGASQYSAGATPALYSSVQIYLDSPATTSSVTYKWQAYTFDAPNRVWYMNRTSGDVDTNNQSAPSTITLMEIAQ